MAPEATEYTFDIKSNLDWTLTASEGVTLDKTSGNGNATVKMTFAANTSDAAIVHTVTAKAEGVADKVLKITQATAAAPTVATIAEFLAAAEDATVYQVTGVIASMKEINTQYHNVEVTIKDSEGTELLLFRMKAAADGKSLTDLGLKVGDVLTAVGNRGAYNGFAQMVNPIYRGHVEGAPADGPQVLATFPFPDDTSFDASKVEGETTKWNLAEGWIMSEDCKSRLSAHLADGSALKVTYKYEAKKDSDAEGTKNHVRVLATGMPVGGYWLFEVPVKDMPAGNYTIQYKHSSSNTGANYFLVEVSLDGQNWAPVDAQTSSETFKDGTGARDVTYTYALNKGGVNLANVGYDVNLTYAAPALAGENTLYIRAMVADSMEYRATYELAKGGTNRIWGPCTVTFAE